MRLSRRLRLNLVRAREEIEDKTNRLLSGEGILLKRHLSLKAICDVDKACGCAGLIFKVISDVDKVHRVLVALYALCFRCLVHGEARGSGKVNLLSAVAALPQSNVLTASCRGHRVRCVQVYLCARDTVFVNLVSRRMCTSLYGR